MDVIKFMVAIMTALKPPDDDTDRKANMAWRWSVATVLIILIFACGGSLAWAQGWIPTVPGVATKDDVRKSNEQINTRISTFDVRMTGIERTMTAINLRLVKNDIQKELQNSCTAQVRGNQEALNAANSNLFGSGNGPGLLDQYSDLTGGKTFRIPPCTSILISADPHN